MFTDDRRCLPGAPRPFLYVGLGGRGLAGGLGLLALLGCGERPREREMAEPAEIQGSLPAETSSAERFGIDHGAFAGTAAPQGSNQGGGGAMGSGAPSADVAASMAHGASGLSWQVPEGWRVAPQKPVRIVTFYLGPDDRTECYVSSLAGDGGGARANIDRWRGQMGAKPSTSEEFAALETVRILGVDALLVEVHGGYQGMNGEAIADATMLGAVAPLEGRMLFVKMVGPSEVVAAERGAFLAFCQSLQPEQ